MDTLSDDCQFLIIKLLCLKDQLMLFEATKTEETHRWRSNLRHIWEQNKSYSLKWIHFYIFDMNPALMHDFLSIISPTVHQLKLGIEKPEDLPCWTSYKFPKMRSLKYSWRNDGEFDGEVTAILQLMSGSAQNLEELDFGDSELNEEILKVSVDLPKLRTLTFKLQRQKFLGYVIEKRAKDITKLTINCPYLQDPTVINKLMNLRQLTLRYSYSTDVITIESAILPLPSLERLDVIIYKDQYELEPFLLTLVANHPSIKKLNLCKMSLEKECYIRIRGALKIALKARSTPLSLYFDGIDDDIDEREIRSYFKHSDLEISFKCLESDEMKFDAVKYHFDTINN